MAFQDDTDRFRFPEKGMVMISLRFCVILIVVLFLVQPPVAKCGAPDETTLYAVGDVMLGRYIAKVMKARGSDYPFEQITATLRTGDIVCGNLEAVISPDGVAPFYPDKPYSFHASKTAAQALKRAGFHVLSLANNHAMDYGPKPLVDTRRLLGEIGITTFGAGNNILEARRPVIVIRNNLRFGFLGYGVAHSRAVYAQRNRAGIAPIGMNDIRKDILALRGRVDVLIVSLHWGTEYKNAPSRKQREEAHQIIDWGADLIIGHHPHVMQGIELYKRKLIAYSLGNFVFDQKGNGTDRSFILSCKFRKNVLYSAEIIPLDRFRTYFPKVAGGDEKKRILEDLFAISSTLNPQTAVQDETFAP